MEDVQGFDVGISCNLCGGSHGLMVVLMGKVDVFVQVCGLAVEMIGAMCKCSEFCMVFFGDVEVRGIDNPHSFLGEKE